ncbi:MAG: hypothetical protein PWQ31_581 [Eubacteriales bacterium]|nr:hypothetical protein [Eubacteriales bacterium]
MSSKNIQSIINTAEIMPVVAEPTFNFDFQHFLKSSPNIKLLTASWTS